MLEISFEWVFKTHENAEKVCETGNPLVISDHNMINSTLRDISVQPIENMKFSMVQPLMTTTTRHNPLKPSPIKYLINRK